VLGRRDGQGPGRRQAAFDCASCRLAGLAVVEIIVGALLTGNLGAIVVVAVNVSASVVRSMNTLFVK
jgi:hypothetical protein